MFKTLACLAGAMMGTSALLGWIDPSPTAPAAPISAEEVIQLTRSLVTDGLTLRADQWQDIEIVADPPGGLPGQFLAASAESAEYHFHIGLDGVPRRAAQWTRQEGCDGQWRTVRVQVARRGVGQPMSRGQWLSVRALVSSLGQAVATNEAPLPVHLDREWAETYGFSPGSAVEVPPVSTGTPVGRVNDLP
jgi:hypothetical protein